MPPLKGLSPRLKKLQDLIAEHEGNASDPETARDENIEQTEEPAEVSDESETQATGQPDKTPRDIFEDGADFELTLEYLTGWQPHLDSQPFSTSVGSTDAGKFLRFVREDGLSRCTIELLVFDDNKSARSAQSGEEDNLCNPDNETAARRRLYNWHLALGFSAPENKYITAEARSDSHFLHWRQGKTPFFATYIPETENFHVYMNVPAELPGWFEFEGLPFYEVTHLDVNDLVHQLMLETLAV